MDDGEDLKLQEKVVDRAKKFTYLGSTASSQGKCEKVERIRI